jgi:hypothetical protein
MSEHEEEQPKKEEHWLKTYWRPAMGWQYFVICMFDFLIAPILNAIYFAMFNAVKFQHWDPITLKGAGLYHIAMGAIIGVTAWSRGQEKMSFTSTSTQTPYGSSSSSSFSSGSTTPSSYTPSYSRTPTQTSTYDNEPDPVPKGGPFR